MSKNSVIDKDGNVSYYIGLGRRKASVARIRLAPQGSGQISINKRGLEEYSKGDAGAIYTFTWDVDGELVPSPMHQDPLLLVPDTATGQEVFTWNVPTTQFPQGSYYLRVDCFRRGAPIHFSYHQTKLFIQHTSLDG